jgi:hypothetical protein
MSARLDAFMQLIKPGLIEIVIGPCTSSTIEPKHRADMPKGARSRASLVAIFLAAHESRRGIC